MLWGSAQSLSFAILALTLFRNASLFHGFASPLLSFGQQVAQLLKA
jgi:formylmethanofuran dehydrogenase subunit E